MQKVTTYQIVCAVCKRDTTYGNVLCDDCHYVINCKDAIECVLCGAVKDHAIDATCTTCAKEMATA